jgi:phage minor structural protein
MINIYDKSEKEFKTNGLAVLNECIKCIITEKLNGEYEVSLSYPLYSTKSKYIKPLSIIRAKGQLFRVYIVEKDSNTGIVSAYGRHIFYDLLNYIIDDLKIENKTCTQSLDLIKSKLGISYTVKSNITRTSTLNISMGNAVESIFSIIDLWVGELVRDNFNIEINESKGLNRGVKISYGKNIIGINETINSDNILSRIYPIGYDGLTLSEKYITNPLAEVLYKGVPLAKKIEISDLKTEIELRSAAKSYLLSNIKPDVNYKVDFIKLAKTSEYNDYKTLEQVEVGDTVNVNHEILGIDIDVKVIGLERDILNDKNTKVELGQKLKSVFKFWDSIVFKSSS